jgi:hypothetical protein
MAFQVTPPACQRVGQAYNETMKNALHTPVRRAALALVTLLVLSPMAPAALAQQTPAQQAAAKPIPAPAEPGPGVAGRPDQTIQRIRTEDAGTRIDEVRVGGETQSISVQPKTGNNTPAYEVKPSDSTRGSAPSPSSGDTNGSRVWNVMKF